MSKKVQITIPNDIYKSLVSASEESLRPLATEAVYRIKVGLSQSSVVSSWVEGPIKESITTSFPDPELENALEQINSGPDYGEIVSYIEMINGEGYQPTEDEVGKVKELEKKFNVKYNRYRGVLERREGDKVIVVHRFGN